MNRRSLLTGAISGTIISSGSGLLNLSTNSIPGGAETESLLYQLEALGYDVTEVLARHIWKTRTFLAFGQSNMAGPSVLVPGTVGGNWPLWHTWAMEHETTAIRENPSAPLFVSWGGHSPAEAFARRMRDFNYNVRIIPAAIHGASIDLFDPDHGSTLVDTPVVNSPPGSGYSWIKHRVTAAGGHLDGMIVQHGEADHNQSAFWAAGFTRLVQALRSEFGDFPVTIGETTGVTTGLATFNSDLPSLVAPIGNITVVPTAHRPNLGGDQDFHFTRPSLDSIGSDHASLLQPMMG